jgi:hypothetical protein
LHLPPVIFHLSHHRYSLFSIFLFLHRLRLPRSSVASPSLHSSATSPASRSSLGHLRDCLRTRRLVQYVIASSPHPLAHLRTCTVPPPRCSLNSRNSSSPSSRWSSPACRSPPWPSSPKPSKEWVRPPCFSLPPYISQLCTDMQDKTPCVLTTSQR